MLDDMKIEHRLYSKFAERWTKVRDVIEGEEAVKSKLATYLPRLASQQDAGNPNAIEAYRNYVLRAGFYGAAQRTQMGLVGAVLGKEPAVEGIPDDLRDQIDDAIGLAYDPLDSVVAQVLRELVGVGRIALLVDKDQDPESMPYVVQFRAEDVVHWRNGMVGGREVPVLIVIRQAVEESNDELGVEVEQIDQFLVLQLTTRPDQHSSVPGFEGFAGAPDLPVYWQSIWRDETERDSSGKAKGLAIVEIRVPTKNGGRFWTEIPCDVVNAVGGIKTDPENPPMLALANTVLAHYRSSADLEWGRHLTAIPQPWASGFDLKEGEQLVVGSGFVWVTPQTGANIQYLEFSGAGLGHIAEGLKDKQAQMAVEGARMLEEQPNQPEAMGTVRLRQAGDRSVLGTIAHNASVAVTRAIQRWLAWLRPAFDSDTAQSRVKFELDSDFDTTQLDPAALTALTSALQAGTMSWETYAFNLRRGELLPPGVTDDDERERIQKGAPGRSRQAELEQLQADVQAGRLSVRTYLEQIQALGMLEGVDIEAELAAIEDEKLASVERQITAFSQSSVGGQAQNADQPPKAAKAQPDQGQMQDAVA